MRVFFLAVLVITFGCRQVSVTSFSQLRSFCEDAENGLIKEVKRNGIRIVVSYVPSDWIILSSVDGKTTTSAIDSARDAFRDSYYFRVSIEKGNSFILHSLQSNESAYNQAFSYLNSDIEKDISIRVEDRSYNPYDFYFLSSPSDTSLILLFKLADPPDSDIEVLFNDRLFGSGLNRFFFTKEDIAKVPNLTLSHTTL